jgi:hypothetical protein
MIWHVAFAVGDIEDAMERFGAALNLKDWVPVRHVSAPSVDAQGKPYHLDTRLTFATDGQCALELFEARPGTPNEPALGTVFHHMGFWTDDVGEEQARLEQCGWSHRGNPTTPESRAAFFAGSLGIFFEACNAQAQRPGLEKYYPGGPTGIGQPGLTRR